MSNQGMSMKELSQMINSIMGHNVLSEQQLQRIMQGAKKAHDRGGMVAVIDYLMRVTQADIDPQEVLNFAEQVKSNPNMGMDILTGKKNIHPKKRRKK
jgi:hypothetical protein